MNITLPNPKEMQGRLLELMTQRFQLEFARGFTDPNAALVFWYTDSHEGKEFLRATFNFEYEHSIEHQFLSVVMAGLESVAKKAGWFVEVTGAALEISEVDFELMGDEFDGESFDEDEDEESEEDAADEDDFEDFEEEEDDRDQPLEFEAEPEADERATAISELIEALSKEDFSHSIAVTFISSDHIALTRDGVYVAGIKAVFDTFMGKENMVLYSIDSHESDTVAVFGTSAVVDWLRGE